MPARRVTTVTMPVDGRSGVAFEAYRERTPLLTIWAARPGLLVTLTLPEHLNAGHVRFARDLAATATRYATEVERAWRGLPGELPVRLHDVQGPGRCCSTGRGSSLFVPCPSTNSGRNPSMMADQPARVTPGEISALLDQVRRLIAEGASLADQIIYYERKAGLLSRIAATLDTPEAHQVAADAWHHVGKLARQRDAREVRP
jgi:hypothetical protein